MIGGLVAKETITRLRADRVSNGYGGFEDDWSDPDESDIPGWGVDAGGTVADLDRREGAQVQYTLRGPVAADVRRGDRVRWNGEVYTVDGRPRVQPGPTALTSHLIVQLILWEG